MISPHFLRLQIPRNYIIINQQVSSPVTPSSYLAVRHASPPLQWQGLSGATQPGTARQAHHGDTMVHQNYMIYILYGNKYTLRYNDSYFYIYVLSMDACIYISHYHILYVYTCGVPYVHTYLIPVIEHLSNWYHMYARVVRPSYGVFVDDQPSGPGSEQPWGTGNVKDSPADDGREEKKCLPLYIRHLRQTAELGTGRCTKRLHKASKIFQTSNYSCFMNSYEFYPSMAESTSNNTNSPSIPTAGLVFVHAGEQPDALRCLGTGL